MDEAHRTVLQKEAVDALALTQDATAVDVTLGGGGHAREISARLGEKGRLIMIDADPETLHRTRTKMQAEEAASGAEHIFVHANFRELSTVLRDLHVSSIDALIADLGWNSEQFAASGRGFSFRREHADEPLHMTYGDPEKALFTARDVIMEWAEEDIANVLYGYGEERYARRIAKAVIERRDKLPIETVGALVETIESAVPGAYMRGKIHPATKTFQALRIAVNDELGALRDLIEQAIGALGPAGRLAIITFHSLEDRIVKQRYKELAQEGIGTIITKKPITPSREELTRNPRARSAKLRIFEKTS